MDCARTAAGGPNPHAFRLPPISAGGSSYRRPLRCESVHYAFFLVVVRVKYKKYAHAPSHVVI